MSYLQCLIVLILDFCVKDLTPGVFNSLLDALITGLDDYTVDERGDVGSWIRITCIGGLTTITEILVSRSESIDEYSAYMSPETYHTAVTGILKQGLERLDNVRHEAGECMMRLLRLSLPNTDKCERWTLPSVSLLRELFIMCVKPPCVSVYLLNIPKRRNGC